MRLDVPATTTPRTRRHGAKGLTRVASEGTAVPDSKPDPTPMSAPIDGPTRLLTRGLGPVFFWICALAIVVVSFQYASSMLLERPQLEPDDFRFVARALDLRPAAGLASGLVENSWDALPFVDVEGGVRFWRPVFPWSFDVDAATSDGFAGPLAMPHTRFGPILLTNLVLHLACCVLAFALCVRICGRNVAALLGGLLFACFAPHAEAIWYGSGRNATLLSLGFVTTWLVHTSRPTSDLGRVFRRTLAPLAFGFAIFAKETAVVLLPLLWISGRLGVDDVGESGTERSPARERREPGLWLSYAAVFVFWAVLRTVALGGFDTGQLVEPYVYVPWTSSFWSHALVSLAGSLDAIGLATPLAPFLMPAEFFDRHSLLGVGIGLALTATLVWLTWRSPRGRVLIAFALLTWLPAVPVYVSERYLYLPSFAVAGLAALAVSRLARERMFGAPVIQTWCAFGLAVIVIAGSLQHLSMLRLKHESFSFAPRPAWALSRALDEFRARPTDPRASARTAASPRIPRGAKLLIVDFPSDVVHAQFFEDQMRVECNDPDLEIRILNLLPESANQRVGKARIVVERRAENLELRGLGRPVLERGGARRLFPIVDLQKGSTRSTKDGSVRLTILEGDGTAARRVRIDLAHGFEKARILRYEPPIANFEFAQRPPGVRLAAGRFVLDS